MADLFGDPPSEPEKASPPNNLGSFGDPPSKPEKASPPNNLGSFGDPPSGTENTGRLNIPVLVGVVPLLAVTSFILDEGYKVTPIAASNLKQMVAPTSKTIKIEALLIKGERALRPALETLALTSRFLGAAAGVLAQFAGIPVVAKNGVYLDMQITSLTFTQDNQMRDTLRVSMSLVQVPRSSLLGLLGGLGDLAVGVGTAFI